MGVLLELSKWNLVHRDGVPISSGISVAKVWNTSNDLKAPLFHYE